MSHREEARGRPRTRWRDYVSQLAWERLWVPQEELEGSVWGEGSLGISAQTAASSDPAPDKADEDGWMDGRLHRMNSTGNVSGTNSGHGALTEIQELLHGQRRRRELGEMIDVFGHVGQSCSLHQGADSLHFTDDVVLLASSSQDLQHVLERFAAECEAAGMTISTSKSETPWSTDRKRVVCPLRVGGEVLPQVEEFKYLGVLFTSEGKMEREIDRRIGAASAVMRSVYWTVMVKKELSRKARSSRFTGQSTFPPLTYGHELWIMSERTRSRIQMQAANE
ncbi:hypothetical protein L3Q82_014642 [Scortum barcoo]|uniref:Uncharacterized protein n=1 Tax=Scortum barcoo TaxID=214431 RepID=A0ACB8VY15_9TELE|nr:hypothetical protein L3Q82_014642 [Scortum barcoo]